MEPGLADAASRYPKAIGWSQQVWRSRHSWDEVSAKLQGGFPTLLAALLLGSEHGPEHFAMLTARLRGIPLADRVARLTRMLYGLRWGIDALPSDERALAQRRTFSAALAWRIAHGETARTAGDGWMITRPEGRAAARAIIRHQLSGERFECDVDPAVAVIGRMIEGLETNPQRLKEALLPPARNLPATATYVGWSVRVPIGAVTLGHERGHMTISGAVDGGQPSIDYFWRDWDGFMTNVTRPDGPLRSLRARALAPWEAALESERA